MKAEQIFLAEPNADGDHFWLDQSGELATKLTGDVAVQRFVSLFFFLFFSWYSFTFFTAYRFLSNRLVRPALEKLLRKKVADKRSYFKTKQLDTIAERLVNINNITN